MQCYRVENSRHLPVGLVQNILMMSSGQSTIPVSGTNAPIATENIAKAMLGMMVMILIMVITLMVAMPTEDNDRASYIQAEVKGRRYRSPFVEKKMASCILPDTNIIIMAVLRLVWPYLYNIYL